MGAAEWLQSTRYEGGRGGPQAQEMPTHDDNLSGRHLHTSVGLSMRDSVGWWPIFELRRELAMRQTLGAASETRQLDVSELVWVLSVFPRKIRESSVSVSLSGADKTGDRLESLWSGPRGHLSGKVKGSSKGDSVACSSVRAGGAGAGSTLGEQAASVALFLS